MSGGGNWWQRWTLLFPAATLVAAVGVQSIAFWRETPRPRGPHLGEHVPRQITGWRGRDMPLGPNEYVADAATRILNYDEYVYREYARGEVRFGAYVAYWGPGKMPTRFVASHTPDRCWTENGWSCRAMRFRDATAIDGRPLLPAEWRQFEPPGGGSPVFVLYWHLVNGRLSATSGRFNAIPNPMDWWRDAMQQYLHGSSEQYFIRLTSNVPFERLWADRGVRELIDGLRGLGLEAADPGPSATPRAAATGKP